MSTPSERVAATIADIIARRPVLAPVLNNFAPILEARAALPAQLAASVRESGLSIPEWKAAHASLGVSMLSAMSLDGIEIPLREAAKTLLPLLRNIETVARHDAELRRFFACAAHQEGKMDDTPANGMRDLADDVLHNASGLSGTIRNATAVPDDILLFCFRFVLSPVLQALVESSLPREEGVAAPWDAGSGWRHGYCPVCGAAPSIAYLDKPIEDGRNEFLTGGGGKKHLHCSRCGSEWAFPRGVCPACGKEGAGVLEILREASGAQGERLDWCTKCKHYCPCVDLRAKNGRPDMDAMALGLMHLDMIAADRHLKPLQTAFWNTF